MPTINNVDLLLDELHELIISYLDLNPSQSTIKKPAHQFFMDFPNNSVQYHLYTIEKSTELLGFQHVLSQEILSSFPHEIDDSEILLFLFYLLLVIGISWTKTTGKNMNNEIANKLKCNNIHDHTQSQEISQACSEIFMDNKDLFVNTFKYIMLQKTDFSSNQYSLELYNAYHNLLINSISNVIKDEQIIFPLDFIITNQFNVKNITLKYVYYLIHLCYVNND
jgi:hypothetical protein